MNPVRNSTTSKMSGSLRGEAGFASGQPFVNAQKRVSNGMKTRCAICNTFDNAMEVYPPQLIGEALDEKAFSARRFYDKKIHFRIVRCNHCGLLRSDPALELAGLEKFYRESKLTYDNEISNIRKTYGQCLARLVPCLESKNALLEIGCGNGFMLEEALEQSFKDVIGVEPSVDAVRRASERVRDRIATGLFSRNLFKSENGFDAICIFGTFWHFADPSQVLKDSFQLLKPGGAILITDHNIKSWSSILLGEKSPVIDIEHCYFFDRDTYRQILQKNGFKVVEMFRLWNTYSVNYFFSLIPLRPVGLKLALNQVLRATGLSNLTFAFPLGNLGIIAQKI